MKILFLMYPWERIKPETDSSLRLIHESARRGYMVAVATTNSLTIRNSVASAFCDVITPGGKMTASVPNFYKKAKLQKVQLPLTSFDAIFMRANPPLEPMALNFLDAIHREMFVINGIDGIRMANNKLYTTTFYDARHDFIPVTHVSKNREYLEQAFDECEQKKMILKPLAGHGGQGVIVVEKSARHSFRSLLDFYIDSDERSNGRYVILQEYVEGAQEGDVRIMMLNGEPIGAMRRVPAEGDIRSNIHAGGTFFKHTLTQRERDLCSYIGPKLVKDGLFFVGVDVIQGKLIEVNVMSPGGVTRINQLDDVCLQSSVMDFVEKMVQRDYAHASFK